MATWIQIHIITIFWPDGEFNKQIQPLQSVLKDTIPEKDGNKYLFEGGYFIVSDTPNFGHSAKYEYFKLINDKSEIDGIPEYSYRVLKDGLPEHYLKYYDGLSEFINTTQEKSTIIEGNKMTPEQKEQAIIDSPMYFAATTLGIEDKYAAICRATPEDADMGKACEEAFKKASIGLNQKTYSSDKTEAYNTNLKEPIEKFAKEYGLSQVEVLTFIKDNILPKQETMDALRVVAEDGLKVDGIEWAKKGKNAKLPEELRAFLKRFEAVKSNQTNKMNDLIGSLYKALVDENTRDGSKIRGTFVDPTGYDYYADKKKKKVSSAKTAVGKDLVEDIKISK